jgi:predicted dehydrogenase
MKEVRVGILGTARIARRLVGQMQAVPGFSVKAVASRMPQRAAWYAEQYGIERACVGYDEILESSEIDAVYIPLPPALHAVWAQKAAHHGKHVLCEKPLATTLIEAQHMAAACEASGVCWLDATAWLHHPRTSAMREKVVDGALGDLRHLSVSVTFFEPFQENDHRLDLALGGGCLLDLGWYCASAIVWAEHPAICWTVDGYQVDGCWRRVVAQGSGAAGQTVHLECAYDSASRKQFELAGTERVLNCDDFTRPWQESEGSFRLRDRAGTVSHSSHVGHQERLLLQHWLEGIRGQLDLNSYQAAALRTQLLVEQLQAALAT